MQFNKNQKIVSITYCTLLVLILFNLTPAFNEADGKTFYGSVFAIADYNIYYKKLLIEVGLLTIVFALAFILLKDTPKIPK